MSKIEKDTQIIPWIMAEGVVDAAQAITGESIKNYHAAEKYLTEHAEAVYAHNVTFRKKVQSEADHGNAGRDHLYAFMQHWLAAWLRKHDSKVFKKLPHGFAVGR